MKPEIEFKDKLDALVQSIAPEGRGQVRALIASIVNSGGTSEQALIDMLQNKDIDPVLRLNACWLVPRLRIAAARNVLEELMSDPSEQMRMEAATGLGLVPQDDAVEVLSDALERNGSKPVRLAVLHALGIRSSPRSAVAVMRVLQNSGEDAEVRADAAEALAHIKDERITAVLIDSLQDRSPLVRYSAAYALGEQGDARALPKLREIAAHDRATTPWGTVASRALHSIEAITRKFKES